MEQARRGELPKVRHLPLELPRQPHVVGVQKCDEAPARARDAFVAGAARPAVSLPHQNDAVSVFGDAQRRVVGRAVVDHDHLEGSIALREHGRQGRSDSPAGVECRDDD